MIGASTGRLGLLLGVLLLGACGRDAATPVEAGLDHEAWAAGEVSWREARERDLRRPDGWLSLVGLHWFTAGSHTVGSADGSGIRLAEGPGRLGVIELDGDGLRFVPAPDAGVVVDGVAAGEAVALTTSPPGPPTVVAWDAGQSSFLVLKRGDRHALRVRDTRARTRVGFTALDWFALDPAWRIEARFDAHPEGRTIDIANITGSLDAMPNPGAAVFERDGRRFSLEAVDEGGRLFFIFADRSNADATYGAGRFLYADPGDDGQVILDFNRAYNPPCAFNAYSTCPLPPPENRLDLRIDAGEKRYTGPTS